MSPPNSSDRPVLATLKSHALLVGALTAGMWILEGVDTVLGGSLDRFGIHPRSLEGLVGILFAPFLHGGFGHLISNTIPFIVLSLIVMMHRRRDWWVVTGLAGGLGGLLVWLTGASNSVHIGASSLIFGYLGYLLSRGAFQRKVGPILLSLAVLFGYGGVLYGVLPGQPGISWQGHLFGFLAGILGARLLATRERKEAGQASTSGPTRAERPRLPPAAARIRHEPVVRSSGAEAESEAEIEEELERLRARSRQIR